MEVNQQLTHEDSTFSKAALRQSHTEYCLVQHHLAPTEMDEGPGTKLYSETKSTAITTTSNSFASQDTAAYQAFGRHCRRMLRHKWKQKRHKGLTCKYLRTRKSSRTCKEHQCVQSSSLTNPLNNITEHVCTGTQNAPASLL